MNTTLTTQELKQAIDSVIDYFNDGGDINQDFKLELLLLSAKLDAFVTSTYNIG